MAYRKGRSAEDIVTTVICALEEVHVTGDVVSLIFEDEDFFDRRRWVTRE